MIDDCTGLILAGGESRRMGRDKTTLEFDGQTLLQRSVRLLQDIFPRVLVSVRQPRGDVALPQVVDEAHCAGPLAGLCAGLAQADTLWVFALAADMPFLGSNVIRQLGMRRGECEAVVPVIGGVSQPLAAYYAVAALPVLRTTLTGLGKRSPRASLQGLNVVYVNESELRGTDPTRDFIDLDTPADLMAVMREMKISY
jgi:molybdopterin-guanine dinucleotide biosynthesis protein A